MVVGVERTIFHRLVKAFVSPENVFAVSIADLKQVHGVGNNFATAIFGFDVDRSTDRELGLAQKENICILTLKSKGTNDLIRACSKLADSPDPL